MNPIFCSVNVGGVVLLFGGGGHTSILNAVIEAVSSFSNPGQWGSKNLVQIALTPPYIFVSLTPALALCTHCV